MEVLINENNKVDFLAFLVIIIKYQILLNHYNLLVRLLFIKAFLNFMQNYFINHFIVYLLKYNWHYHIILKILLVLLLIMKYIHYLLLKFQ